MISHDIQAGGRKYQPGWNQRVRWRGGKQISFVLHKPKRHRRELGARGDAVAGGTYLISEMQETKA